MTPKGKAEVLVNEFYHQIEHYLLAKDALLVSKICAIIAVKQIIEAVPTFEVENNYNVQILMGFYRVVLDELQNPDFLTLKIN